MEEVSRVFLSKRMVLFQRQVLKRSAGKPFKFGIKRLSRSLRSSSNKRVNQTSVIFKELKILVFDKITVNWVKISTCPLK